MISKELFSEVMNIKIEDIVDLKMFGKELNYYEKCLLNFCCDGRLSKYKDSICKSVNIYELAHKCKEWATKHNFHLVSWTISYESVKNKGYCQTHNTQDSTKENDKPFRESTEIEAIFKACQWILDNKEG